MLVESRRIRDRYRLLEPIGGGAMGTVWRAHDERLDRTVAIKELLLPYGQDEQRTEDAKNRAMREARIAARLQHSHAITVFAVLDEEDRPWLIMEYLASQSFALTLREEPASVDTAINVGAQVSSALAAAHRVGIVHRDVKPANILVGDDGTAKITDFGISRAIGDVKLTATGEIAGTPAYLAPEVARGEDADFASDVFSLGATLYAAVEGKPPYGTADNPIALLYRASSGEISPPEKAGRLTPLLTRMLASDPADRPSMTEVARELAELKAGEAPASTLPAVPVAEPVVEAAAPTVPEVSQVSAGGRRGLIAVGAGAALLCVAVVVAILLVVRQKPPTDQAAPPTTPAPLAAASSSQSVPPPTPSTAVVAPPPATEKPTVSTVASATTAGAALTEYYGQLLSNLNASYARLTSKFTDAYGQTPQTYAQWWSQFKSVSAKVVSENGPSVRAVITYVRKSGKTSVETNSYTLVQRDGTWLIDTQRAG